METPQLAADSSARRCSAKSIPASNIEYERYVFLCNMVKATPLCFKDWLSEIRYFSPLMHTKEWRFVGGGQCLHAQKSDGYSYCGCGPLGRSGTVGVDGEPCRACLREIERE